MNDQDLIMAKQIIADITQIMTAAQRDILARGGYADSPASSTLVGCLLGIVGAAGTGDLEDAHAALTQISVRALVRHGRL